MKLISQCLLAFFMCMPLLSLGNTAQCAKIKDNDKRYLCTAVGLKNLTVCNEISTQDGAFHCKAMTMGSSGYCEKVNLGNRAQCLLDLRNQQRKSMWGVS